LKPVEERNIEYLEEVAIKTAAALADGSIKIDRKRPLVERLTKYAIGFEFVRNKIFEKAKDQVMKQTNGLYPAPLKVCASIIYFILIPFATHFRHRSNILGEATEMFFIKFV
jgi:hypothetical protein